jgi:hypothetical protein
VHQGIRSAKTFASTATRSYIAVAAAAPLLECSAEARFAARLVLMRFGRHSAFAFRRGFATALTSSPIHPPRHSFSLFTAHYARCIRPFRNSPPVPICYRRLHSLVSPMPAPGQQNGESHEASTKRKQPPTPSNERPLKQIKPESDTHARNGSFAAASPEPHNDRTPSPDVDMDMPMPPVAGGLHDTAEWQKTIESVVKSVVSIHFCQTCSFDTDPAVASEATGFVVDAERGYILTNRVGATLVEWT